MKVSVLSGVSGISVLEQQLADKGIQTPFEELEMQYKSSAFWISFQNHNGKYIFMLLIISIGEFIETQKKYWSKHFQIDKETNKGKTDFQLNIVEQLEATNQLRDFIRSNQIFKIWQTDPVFQNNAQNEPEIVIEVYFNSLLMIIQAGLPKIERKMIGISRINTFPFIQCGKDQTNSPLLIHGKHQLFPSHLLTVPQYLLQNNFLKLNEKDQAILQQNLQEEKKKKEQEQLAKKEAQLANTPPPAAKQAKKADKKDPKAGKKDAKAASAQPVVQIQDSQDIQILSSYVITEKDPNNINSILSDLYPANSKKGIKNPLSNFQKRKAALINGFTITESIGPLLTIKIILNEEDKKEEQEPKPEEIAAPTPQVSKAGKKKTGKK